MLEIDVFNVICSEQSLPLFLQNYVSAAGIEVFSSVSHTLFNLADTIEKGASYYLLNDSYSSLMQLMSTNEWRKTTIELSVIF
ncbi:hypothetical protein V6N13_104909 [Hibiscus sabdariffa]